MFSHIPPTTHINPRRTTNKSVLIEQRTDTSILHKTLRKTYTHMVLPYPTYIIHLLVLIPAFPTSQEGSECPYSFPCQHVKSVYGRIGKWASTLRSVRACK